MTPVVDKVEKLIALAGSNIVAEARTSAFLACKLIRDHGLRVVAELPAARAAKAEPAQERDPVNQGAPRRIILKYRARCRGCGAWLDVGARAMWLRGNGVMHELCFHRRRS